MQHGAYQSIKNFLHRVMAKTFINGVNPKTAWGRKKSKSDMQIYIYRYMTRTTANLE